MNVSQRGAARLRHGHVWVYRSDLLGGGEYAPGSLVSVADERGNLIGTAFYSSSSQIALRLLSSGPVAEPELAGLIAERVRAAIALRQVLVKDSDAYRVVFSEADFLPGFIADKYNDIISVQALTQAADAAGFRETAIGTLREELKPAAIVERVDERIRELEQLEAAETRGLVGEKTSTVFTMNGVRFHYEATAGQKTGAFLDQRENYAAAASYARGEALDVFTYHGGFALHLARKCTSVEGVDSSGAALATAEENRKLNSESHQAALKWTEASAFDLLKSYASSGRQYDTIVVDPPAFAKTKRDVPSALNGYKELNLRAMKMLRAGGILVTCTCSHHVSEEDFIGMLRSAASDARRAFRVLEKRGQAKDHPVLLNVPETSYLKCIILQM